MAWCLSKVLNMLASTKIPTLKVYVSPCHFITKLKRQFRSEVYLYSECDLSLKFGITLSEPRTKMKMKETRLIIFLMGKKW